MKILSMKTNHSKAAQQRGVTLVELMVAMALALAILAAIGYVYIQGRTGFRVQDAQSRIQEELRSAVEVLKQDLSSAGRFGCHQFYDRDSTNLEQNTSFVLTGEPPYLVEELAGNKFWIQKDRDGTNKQSFMDVSYLLRGFSDGAGWPASNNMKAKRKAGTDTIVLMRGGADESHLASTDAAANFEANKNARRLTEFTPKTKVGEQTGSDSARLLVISDCKRGELVKASVNAAGVVSIDNTLNIAVGIDSALEDNSPKTANDYEVTKAMVTPFQAYSYYVAESPTSKRLTLYRIGIQEKSKSAKDIGAWADSSAVPLISGVEDMQVRFSVNPDGTATGRKFMTPKQIDDAQVVGAPNIWLSVNAIQVTLTLISDAENVATAGDGRLRQNVTFTVDTRNTARDLTQVRNLSDQGINL
jgi:type IV pilus assembly protein PilW